MYIYLCSQRTLRKNYRLVAQVIYICYGLNKCKI